MNRLNRLPNVVYMHMIIYFHLSLVSVKFNFSKEHLVGPFFFSVEFQTNPLAIGLDFFLKFDPGKLSYIEF